MSDDQQFQSAQKQCSLEIVNINHFRGFSLTPRKRIHDNNIGWKFQKIKRMIPPTTSPRKPDTKNISFQTDDLEEMSQEQDQNNQNENHISMFAQKYKDCQRVYKKQKSLGTSWIGHRQYFASIFIDPTILAKTDISIFKKKPIPIQQQQSKPYTFNSDFQSGNLFAVYSINKNQYDLILQNDINSKGNTQWFYFEIANIPAKTKIKFNIVNMLKSDSLFNYGMQPCIYSVQAQRRNGLGWHRAGSHIKYFKNNTKIDGSHKYYYTLTFTLMTSYDNDTLKVAQSFPYTYQDLNNFIKLTQKKPGRKAYIKRQSAGQTIGKNNLQVLKIIQQNPRKKNPRPIIIITARQHPGQTPSSYVCEGFIQFITSDQKQASFLRKNYQIYILPMLNPDGVLVGNYRTNLCGVDLNRRWDGSKSKIAQQTILIKKYILQITKNRQVAFMIDLHGHSRKLFSFFYGNSNIQNPLQVRLFPYVCAKISENMIRFQDSTFVCEQAKRQTARVQLASKFKISNVFTFQTSFYGYINNKRQRIHYSQQKLKYLGVILGKGIFLHERFKTCSQSLQAILVSKYLQELINKPQLIQYGQKAGSGSQTQPQKGQIDDLQFAKIQSQTQQPQQPKIQKNTIKNSKKQIIVKQISKQSRQLHVMDIARVNSIFPNDVLALMPASLGKKGKQKQLQKQLQKQKQKQTQKQRQKIKRQINSVMIQTQQVSIIKIYDMCRVQDLRQERQNQIKKKIMIKNQNQTIAISRSNLFRTIVRPKSSSNSYLQPNLSTPKRQIKKRHQSGFQLRDKKQNKKQNKKISTGCQTVITFSPDADFMARTLDSLMISPVSKGLQAIKRKTNFATFSPQIQSSARKTSSQSFKIGLRALNVQTWRIKKKNYQ